MTLDKGRAPGDCGTQTRWRYDGQRFSLVRYARQPQCDNWQGPDAWPTLWVTRSVPRPHGNDMLNGKAEVREELIRGGRFTVAGHADDFAF
ncbi:Protein of uncharacterised function (DUF1176) [Klebsiella michiganensis]|nr:Protein of uncharacterised function (DUF1176) [Klebsiella michiganensis]